MRRSEWFGLIAAMGLALVPSSVLAGDVENTLADMQKRLGDLEERLDATTDELDAANQRVEQQEQLIHNAGLTDARGSSSGIASFLETLEIGGWVAASYLYNFNEPDGSALQNANGGDLGLYPFHPDANSFSLDQLWFELEKPVSEESRGGFRADIAFGKGPGILSGSESETNDGYSGNDFNVYQAYAQYLAPIGPAGIKFIGGVFATPIGVEVMQSPYNFNITRGNVYQLFQPINHTGIMASVENAGAFFKLGAVNETRSFPAADVDVNNDKAAIWSLGYGQDTWTVSFNGAYGSSEAATGCSVATTNCQRAGNKEMIYDLILMWDPVESFSAYVNADWIDSDNDPIGAAASMDTQGYGVAVGGRYALTERLGMALRGEWVDLETQDGDPVSNSDVETQIWGVTGTLDYALTEKLMVRGEVRYDESNLGDEGSDRIFFQGNGEVGGEPLGTESDQLTAAVEVIYNF